MRRNEIDKVVVAFIFCLLIVLWWRMTSHFAQDNINLEFLRGVITTVLGALLALITGKAVQRLSDVSESNGNGKATDVIVATGDRADDVSRVRVQPAPEVQPEIGGQTK